MYVAFFFESLGLNRIVITGSRQSMPAKLLDLVGRTERLHSAAQALLHQALCADQDVGLKQCCAIQGHGAGRYLLPERFDRPHDSAAIYCSHLGGLRPIQGDC